MYRVVEVLKDRSLMTPSSGPERIKFQVMCQSNPQARKFNLHCPDSLDFQEI